MKYVHQFLIIMTISFIGELVGLLLPLPIPASVYGLALMNVGNAIIKDLLVIGIVTLISTIVVMIVTGKVAQVIIERKEDNDNG